MKAIKTLGATLLVAGFLTSVAPAGASARDFEGYIACGRSAQAPEARSCPRSRVFSVFFRSLDATVLFHFCVKFPNGRECSKSLEAEHNHLYRQGIHPGLPGKYRVTFFVDGDPIGSKAVQITR
jgi:hypothetical protein